MNNTQLSVGVIGAGMQGTAHLQDLSANPRVRLAAVCDQNRDCLKAQIERFRAPTGYESYEEMLDDETIAAVVIVLPDHLHRDVTIAALDKGKHVLLEKPMALNNEDAEAIAAAAGASDKCFMLNLSNRWMYPFAKGKELVDSAHCGRVRYVFARMSNRIEIPTKILPWLKTSHPAFWIGIHRLDIARWWIGAEAVRVRAVHRFGVLRERGIDVPDLYQATIEFDGGAVLNLEGSWILPNAFPNVVDSKFYAICDHHVIDIDRLRSELMIAGSEKVDLATPTTGPLLEQQGGFTYAASRHFVDCALSGRQPLVTAADGVALTRILSAVIKSCENDGEIVTL